MFVLDESNLAGSDGTRQTVQCCVVKRLKILRQQCCLCINTHVLLLYSPDSTALFTVLCFAFCYFNHHSSCMLL